MLIGLCGTLFSVTMFGFSTSFAMAVLSRFLWGLLNGNSGISKCCLAEACILFSITSQDANKRKMTRIFRSAMTPTLPMDLLHLVGTLHM